jgi:hypothetical protein
MKRKLRRCLDVTTPPNAMHIKFRYLNTERCGGDSGDSLKITNKGVVKKLDGDAEILF